MERKVTTDHEEIKSWAERSGGRPEVIDDPHAEADVVAPRIGFPHQPDDSQVSPRLVREVLWEEFFAHFEEQSLAFEFQEPMEPGVNPIDAYQFIHREELPRPARQR